MSCYRSTTDLHSIHLLAYEVLLFIALIFGESFVIVLWHFLWWNELKQLPYLTRALFMLRKNRWSLPHRSSLLTDHDHLMLHGTSSILARPLTWTSLKTCWLLLFFFCITCKELCCAQYIRSSGLFTAYIDVWFVILALGSASGKVVWRISKGRLHGVVLWHNFSYRKKTFWSTSAVIVSFDTARRHQSFLRYGGAVGHFFVYTLILLSRSPGFALRWLCSLRGNSSRKGPWGLLSSVLTSPP